jgi:uncharacterized protein
MKKITIKVIPRSSQNKLVLLEDGTYKAKLTAPPVDGEANAALIKLLSKEFNVAKSCIHLIKGESGRVKIISIDIA